MPVSLDMTLRECLEKYPQLREFLYRYIEECIYCEGFKDETLEIVLKAHRFNPMEVLEEINRFLAEGE